MIGTRLKQSPGLPNTEQNNFISTACFYQFWNLRSQCKKRKSKKDFVSFISLCLGQSHFQASTGISIPFSVWITQPVSQPDTHQAQMRVAPGILPSSFHPGCREIIFIPVTAPSLPHLLPLASTLFLLLLPIYRANSEWWKALDTFQPQPRTHMTGIWAKHCTLKKMCCQFIDSTKWKHSLSSPLSPAVCLWSFAVLALPPTELTY